MGQPPNLRELISSADGVTFWASYEKAEQRARLRAARPRGGPARRCSRPKAAARPPPPPEPPLHRLPPMRVIDVMHLGRPHVIGCWEVDGVLVDPGPESSLPTAARGARRRAAAGAAADPHPPRPRRRHRGAGAALAGPRGLRARARRPAPDRSLEAAGQRRAPLRRQLRAPLGRDRAGARGQRDGRSAAARPCWGCASPTPPATPPTTSATCTRRAAPPSSATSPPAGSRPPA